MGVREFIRPDEEHVRSSHVWNSSAEEDRFGVYWGEEFLDYDEEEEPKKKPKCIRQYASFYLRGRKYCLNDTVYLLSGDGVGPPYIGRIGKLYENVKDKEKQMHVRWFCRPCELPKGLPDVDYSENCKEVFVMWGNGAKNINNPASTVGHCSVLCTAEEDWNTNVRSIEEIAAADHIFDRAYDLRTRTLRSLDSIVKNYGEHLVTGTCGSARAPIKRRGLSKSGKMTAGTRPPREHQPLPLAMRASSDLLPLKLDWQPSEFSGLPALVTSPNTPSPNAPVEGRTESFVSKSSATALKTASLKSNEARSAHSKGAKLKMIPKAANQGSKRPLVKPVRNAATLDSQKRPRVDSSDSFLAQQAQVRLGGGDLPSPGVSQVKNKSSSENTGADSHGNAGLNRERQKGVPNFSGKQMALDEKKRFRVNCPDQGTEKGKLKKPKLSAPFHSANVALKKVSKVKDNVSPSTAIGPKIGELRSPRVPDRNLQENSSGWQQAHQSPTIRKQDGRVSSPSAGERCSSGRPKDEIFSKIDSIGNHTQASPRALSVEVENARLLSPEVVDKRSTILNGKGLSDPKREEIHCLRKQSIEEEHVDVALSSRQSSDPKNAVCLSDASGRQQGSDDISPLHQNGANLKCTDLGQDTKLHKSPADRLERRFQSSMQDDVKEVSPKLAKGQKLSSFNHGKVPADEDVSPTSKQSRLVSEGNRNGIRESPVKHESFLSSKRAGLSSEDSRHAEVGSVQKASKKRPDSELEAGTLKSKTMRNRDPQPVKAEALQVREGLKVKKIGLVAKGVPRVSAKKQSEETKSAETSRLPQGLAGKVAKTVLKNHRISEPGFAAQKDGRAAALHNTVTSLGEHWQEMFEPKKKIFNFPWEETLRIALEQKKALFLQNLDPWFSSAEIEANLQELLQVSCDVRMLPPKNFTCYTSGQAIVLFRTQNAAEEALLKFTENLLIWSKDERPVLASLADAKIAVSNRIHGFYNAELFVSRGLLTAGDDEKNSAATSHCSQPNTVEYEMGIQWRLLQDRHTEAWTIAAQDQKAAIDHPVQKGKPIRP